MQRPSWSEEEDESSMLTYDSSATVVSSRYIPVERPNRTLNHYVSDPYLHVSQAAVGYKPLDARHQRALPQHHPVEPRVRKSSSPAASQHERQRSSMTSISDNHLRVFPMPIPRHTNGSLRNLPKSFAPELEMLDSPNPVTESMEAAWEDASCIDGAPSPRLAHSDPLAGLATSLQKDHERVEDRFEVDALRRQVEQLQMALQLQSQQRELEQLALAESQQRLRRRPSHMQHARMAMCGSGDDWALPPAAPPSRTLPPPPPPTTTTTNPANLRASLLNPAHSAAASMLLNIPSDPSHYASSAMSHEMLAAELALKQAYFDRQQSTGMSIDRRQSEYSLASSPSLSASQTLVEEKKIELLNRKVEALEMMIANMNKPPITAPDSTSTEQVRTSDAGSQTSDSSVFQYNTARPRLVSSASTVTSTTPSITPAPMTKKGTGNKLAAVLGLKKGASSSSLDVSTAGLQGESRISWSRKRTEKVAMPKAKVRQGPGRGRMVIREAAK
ncbi:uncharacterized protein UTRI_04826 [Ustilago trichophora]|uniref:Uncharacterized protein n=1 Tax=Ustilago trichophora TaxID=86804 RepID=A0A5C3EGW1_9BASI|nr:uncharacterized protein UTRI_04826 [Ustilago trichophora]